MGISTFLANTDSITRDKNYIIYYISMFCIKYFILKLMSVEKLGWMIQGRNRKKWGIKGRIHPL